MTVVDQLEPLLLDVSNGRKEFQPTPEEAKELIKKVLFRAEHVID